MVAKKILGARPLNNREKTGLLDKENPPVPRSRQCELLELKRSSSYYKSKEKNKAEEREILCILRWRKRANPRLGLRRCVLLLRKRGYLKITHDKLRRIVKQAEEKNRAEAEEMERMLENLDDPVREYLRTMKQKPIPRKFRRDNN